MTSLEAAERIAKALLERTGIAYSVTAGRGTVQSWIVVDIAVERRALPTAQAEREELARQMGFAHWEGTILIAGTEKARRDHLARALGTELAEPDETRVSLSKPG
ncbi:MAG: hypothetical protein WEF50_12835 [Myxococcota bacterium]